QGEPGPGEKDLGSCVGGTDRKHPITDLYNGKCAAPEKTADQGQQADNRDFGQQFLIHYSSFLSMKSQDAEVKLKSGLLIPRTAPRFVLPQSWCRHNNTPEQSAGLRPGVLYRILLKFTSIRTDR